MSIKEDINSIKGMLSELDEHVKFTEDALNVSIRTYTTKVEATKNALRKISDEDIEKLTSDNVYGVIGNTGFPLQDIREYYENLTWTSEQTEFHEYIKTFIRDEKKMVSDYDELISKRNEVESQLKTATDNYFEYINSPEYKEKKKSQIDELRNKAENESDPVKKKRYQKGVINSEKAMNLEFIFDRIESLGDKEISNITDIFFDNTRSRATIQKFTKKISSIGYNPTIYKMFFNLEEKFLPDEYHDFNNLFLFHVMRFIAYSDISDTADRLFISSILLNIYNLIYHKFKTPEDEAVFIDIIKRFDSKFLNYKEKFAEENITSPNHIKRKEADSQFELKKRTNVIKLLRDKGVDVDINASTTDLIDLYNKITKEEAVEKIKEIQDTETASEEVETEETKEVVDDDSEEVFYDRFRCKYVKVKDSNPIVYDYFDEDGELIESKIPEREILNLINTNNLFKDEPRKDE